ncbi:MAG: recombinase A, partial [Candidatus Hecatellales archaeon]
MNLVETGIEGFDVAFGGLRRGQVILVVGNAGSGKTTFCAKVLYEGAKRFEEPGLFLSTVESKKEFYDYMRLLGMDVKELEEKGLFRFVEMLTPTSKGDLMNLSRELTKNALDMGAR